MLVEETSAAAVHDVVGVTMLTGERYRAANEESKLVGTALKLVARDLRELDQPVRVGKKIQRIEGELLVLQIGLLGLGDGTGEDGNDVGVQISPFGKVYEPPLPADGTRCRVDKGLGWTSCSSCSELQLAQLDGLAVDDLAKVQDVGGEGHASVIVSVGDGGHSTRAEGSEENRKVGIRARVDATFQGQDIRNNGPCKRWIRVERPTATPAGAQLAVLVRDDEDLKVSARVSARNLEQQDTISGRCEPADDLVAGDAYLEASRSRQGRMSRMQGASEMGAKFLNGRFQGTTARCSERL